MILIPQTQKSFHCDFHVSCSPFILNVTLRNHLLKYENTDPDFASGKNTVEDCFELYLKLKARFPEGGFNMRKWASNDQELNQLLEKEETVQLSRLEQFSEIPLTSTRSDKIEDHGCPEATSKNSTCKQC